MKNQSLLRTITLACCLSTSLLLSGCATNFNSDQAVAAGMGLIQAATLSPESIMEAASLSAKEMDSQNQIAPDDSPYTRRLNNLTRNIDTAGLSLNFKVYLSDQLNAFAMPDGTIRVFSGLMDAMPDDQLLAVIYHEIGHVAKKHSFKQMREQMITNSAFQGIASIGGKVGELTSSQLGQLAYQYVNARFSQEDELQSDEYAVKALKRTGKDPAAMKRSIETLQSKFGSGGGFLSSHPSNEARIKHIEAALK